MKPIFLALLGPYFGKPAVATTQCNNKAGVYALSQLPQLLRIKPKLGKSRLHSGQVIPRESRHWMHLTNGLIAAFSSGVTR